MTAASGTIKPTVAKEKTQIAQEREDESEESDNACRSSEAGAEDKSDSEELSDESVTEDGTKEIQRSRKRRRIHEADDLESSYLDRLAREEAKEELQREAVRRGKYGRLQQNKEKDIETVTPAQDESSASSDAEDVTIPQHETIAGLDASTTLEKAARTVFLSNVSTAAIKSKAAKKALLTHLASPLHALQKQHPPPKVESLRFRSTAFASSVGPKRAAFAKKELMDDTTVSTNAYVVYSSEAAARVAASRLNGSIILDRHLRADYAAQPAVIDHRRCVFVGNLSFVDKENFENINESEGGKPRRSKAKEPADAEEGLWRTFSRAGTVESVRVVRDRETRVGKGFAYIQFRDENGVEAALLYNDKKFPPMLPRKMRVMRAKRPKQAATPRGSRTDSREFRTNDRSGKFGNRHSGASLHRGPPGKGRDGNVRKSNEFIFEGHRASSSGGSKTGNLKNKKRSAIKPSTRSSRRASAFKAAGGKRKREH
jgi:nucleolar protein 12